MAKSGCCALKAANHHVDLFPVAFLGLEQQEHEICAHREILALGRDDHRGKVRGRLSDTALQHVEGVAADGIHLGMERNGQDAVATLKKALDNVRPTLEVRSRRVGGSTYQVPVEVKPHRANTLALRWLTSYAKARREKTMTERLTNEILDASNGLGAAVKRREDTHKMAESNRAFAHYRW